MKTKDMLKEFEYKWEHEFYTGQFISCTKIKKFISDLVAEAEAEKQEAVSVEQNRCKDICQHNIKNSDDWRKVADLIEKNELEKELGNILLN